MRYSGLASNSVKDTALPCADLGIQISFLRGCATVGWKNDRSIETSGGNDPGETSAGVGADSEPILAAVSAMAKPT